MIDDTCEWCGWPVPDHGDGLDKKGHPVLVCPTPAKDGFPRHIRGPGAASWRAEHGGEGGDEHG